MKIEKAIKDCDNIFMNLEDMMSEESSKEYIESYKIIRDCIYNSISKDKIKEIKNLADKDNCYQYVIFYEKICELLEE